MKIRTLIFLIIFLILLFLALAVRLAPMFYTTKQTVETIDIAKIEVAKLSILTYIKESELAINTYKIQKPVKIDECSIENNQLKCDKHSIEVMVRGNTPTSGTLIFDNEEGKITELKDVIIDNIVCNYQQGKLDCQSK